MEVNPVWICREANPEDLPGFLILLVSADRVGEKFVPQPARPSKHDGRNSEQGDVDRDPNSKPDWLGRLGNEPRDTKKDDVQDDPADFAGPDQGSDLARLFHFFRHSVLLDAKRRFWKRPRTKDRSLHFVRGLFIEEHCGKVVKIKREKP